MSPGPEPCYNPGTIAQTGLIMKLYPDSPRYQELASRSPRVPVYGERLARNFDPATAYHALYQDAGRSFLFESGRGPHETARFSFFGQANQVAVSLTGDRFDIQNNGTRETLSLTSLDALRRLNFEPGLETIDYIDHFWGGWVGYLAYEMAHWFENIELRPKDGLDLPLLWFFQVDRLWVYDHQNATLKFIVARQTGPAPDETYSQAIQEIHVEWERMDRVLGTLAKEGGSDRSEASGEIPSVHGLQSNITREQYESMVIRAKRYIEEGDIYQANLAHRLCVDYPGPAFDLYRRLRRVNPSPFSGFLQFDDFAIASSSPERLVKVEKDVIETRPIAGTRPRGKDDEEDARLSTELLLNEKEKAEHLMLVDLERNDLGRICDTGTVTVTALMFLEKYSHVSHIVSNIRGRLKPGVDVVDILSAVFPGGTITGCPKIRCMEIIDELEPAARGPYSGSFGYIGFGGHMDLNIIIRTFLVQNGKAYFHVGAGIVADSIPEKEWQETLDKAQALIQALSEETA